MVRPTRSRLLAAAVVVAVIATLSGCAPVVVPDRLLAGTWQSDPDPDGHRAVLVVGRDHSFRACGVPDPVLQAALGDVADWDHRVDLRGHWTRSEDDKVDMDANTLYQAGLRRTVGIGDELYIGGDFGGATLYQYLGDPDSGHRFTFRPTRSATCTLPS
ncbi:hypothetical protein [Leifsonia sp. 22587]|uniref:hypothetical protein n=1 Tax=Leifsonia sp. 22587 TaxID=3453946 RepID=UPI003F8648F2